MTKKQRAAVVELLRCCADLCQFSQHAGIYGTAQLLGHNTWTDQHDPDETDTGTLVWRTARDARSEASVDNWLDYGIQCLEAAARVEEGTWP